MIQFLFNKISATVLITIIAVIFVMPNCFDTTKYQWLPQKTINLGLDLKGGSYVLLKLDFDTYITEQLNVMAGNIRKELRNNKIGYKELKTQRQNINLELRDSKDYSKIENLIKKLEPGISIKFNKNNQLKISFTDHKLSTLRESLIENSMEIIRMRVDGSGTTEANIQKYGDNNIILEVPGIEDPKHLKTLVTKIAKLTFNIVDSESSIQDQHVHKELMLVKEQNNPKNQLLVKKQPAIRGDLLSRANVSFNKYSQPVVSFEFNSLGAKLFANITKEYQGKRLAIILDGKLLSAPVITEPILGGAGIISGNFTIESAKELSLLLKSGALPAALSVIEEKTIGPTLGSDSIQSGKLSGCIGFIIVSIFMLCTYGILGLFANIALFFSLLYIVAILSILQATLTLPGIAGIILTIGMAVDANVLIYERIREELQKGNSILYSIREGFKLSFSTIVDSNITTLLAAIVLYIFGTGAIRGFAITLAIGIVSSMYTATIITRILIDLWVKYKLPIKLNTLALFKKEVK
ncbi:protein-export membrane protein SecD [Orientia chuto str. Dubai]|uniref:Protein translocase subunit SecD n=1 Tax=Orientia chuto str. Dubai TaxID=1359168 RepID=A0A0F3MLC9_9RICK|nr:protein translocase subunit SecD [Candidatus Orientia mediorientalis]KJV56267.1 protein-export membrane protein SecD [Orientia chuto str. Dubai]